MEYHIDYTERAISDLLLLQKDDPKAYVKGRRLIEELRFHPKTGTGKPEPLKGNRVDQWSRRISRKHRLIYTITDTSITVLVLSAYGHYNDK